uniref:Calcium-activated potassium channel subunit beta n=1 Tax=Colobus angolensis palliatus TaxID=336983 RepID=A0A2K5IEA5_COLAP
MQPFSIPVQITLQGSRRRQGRTAFPASGKKRETDCSDGDPLDVHKRLSSTMLLGFAMMGFSVLMFFLLGITILKPFMLSAQREESTCTAIHTDIMDDWLDCAFTCGVHRCGQGKCPCLRVCFYTPKCHQDRNDLLNIFLTLDIKEFFDHKNGTPFSCFYSPDSQSEDVILIKKYDQMAIFHCLFWSSLTLLGGALIVGMVRLTQHLSLLCEKYSTVVRDEVGGKVPYIDSISSNCGVRGGAKEGAEKS